MDMQKHTTWTRLSSLDFDAADAAFPFSARLARENQWPRVFAARAIEEYRKFCFLAVHAGHPVTPSDEVDQVWHLHLTYSQHYWHSLCRDTLGTPLHHGPTEGGAAEDGKFRDWYYNTLASYRRYFGEPPEDLWPSAEERFDTRHEFVRIDRRDVMTLDRKRLEHGAVAALAGVGVLAVANAVAQGDAGSGSDWSGALLVFLAVIGVVVASFAVVSHGRRARTGMRAKRNSRSAGAAGAAPIYASSDAGDCPPGADCNASADGAGSGAAGGCGGGGSGCGGGGS
jgi:hypothetical protein